MWACLMTPRHRVKWASIVTALALSVGPSGTTPALADAPVSAALTPTTGRWRDVLDAPARSSPLAEKGLINGLALAGQAVVAVGQRGHVLRSDDAGQHWQQAQVPLSSDLVAVHFVDADQGWAVGHDGVILHSPDGGRNWLRQLDGRMLARVLAQADVDEAQKAEWARMGAQGPELPWLDVWFADRRTGFVVGAFGLMLMTRDGGRTWSPLMHLLDNPKGLHLHALRGIGSALYVVGEQGLLLKLDQLSQAGRARFHKLDLPYQGSLFGVMGQAALQGPDDIVLVHGLRGTALRSADGGRTWHALETGVQSGLTAATRAPNGHWFLASQTGQLLRSTDQGLHFTRVAIDRPFPAAALISLAPHQLLLAGPRGVQPLPLP